MSEDLGDLELDVKAEMASEEQRLTKLLLGVRSVAVVGASNNPYRPARKVVEFLAAHGLEVLPIAAESSEVGGLPAVPSLSELDRRVDVVTVFCQPSDAAAVAGEAIAHTAQTVWFQDGVRSAEAAAVVNGAGLSLVMDRCIMREYRQLILGEPRRTFFMV